VRDVRVVHQRERLTLVIEAGEHLGGVHARLHDLERHAPANGLALFGEIDSAHAPFADNLDDAIAAEVVVQNRRWGGAYRVGLEIVSAGGAPERALDQAHRAQAGGIAGAQLRSAPGTGWHVGLAAVIVGRLSRFLPGGRSGPSHRDQSREKETSHGQEQECGHSVGTEPGSARNGH